MCVYLNPNTQVIIIHQILHNINWLCVCHFRIARFRTFHFPSILMLLGLKLKDKSVENKKYIIYPFRLCLRNVIKFIQGAFLTCIV